LVDRTISQIQEYYPGAILISQRRKDDVEIRKIHNEIGELQKKMSEKYKEIDAIRHKTNAAANQVTGERRKFVMPCQTNGCRGMLSTAYKCDLCDKYTCSKCFESIDGNKDEHVCVQANIDTAEEIRKNTRPCPTCGCRISKIDGCFAENMPILLWNGQVKMSQHIEVGDVLIGDDGNKRIVEEVCSGQDDLYEIEQNDGITYIVNSKHGIVQENEYFSNMYTAIVNKKMHEQIVHLARSLGFMVNAFAQDADKYIINISGEKIEEIPRKNSIKPAKNIIHPADSHYRQLKSEITVKKVGFGNYYGWNVNDNHRFVLSDFTVVKNCDQMWCVECKTAFSWSKGTVEVGIVHNPHYFQWMRQNGGMHRTDALPGAGCNENRLNTQLSFIRDFFSMLEKSVTCENLFLSNCQKCGYTMDQLKIVMPLVYENNQIIRKTKLCEDLEHAKKAFSSSFFVNFHRFIIHTEHVTMRDLNYKIRTRNVHVYFRRRNTRRFVRLFGKTRYCKCAGYFTKGYCGGMCHGRQANIDRFAQ